LRTPSHLVEPTVGSAESGQTVGCILKDWLGGPRAPNVRGPYRRGTPGLSPAPRRTILSHTRV